MTLIKYCLILIACSLSLQSTIEARRYWKHNPFNIELDTVNETILMELRDVLPETKLSEDLMLEGVWEVDGKKKAMVSGEIVQVGSAIKGYKVLRITSQQLFLKSIKDHRKITLWMADNG